MTDFDLALLGEIKEIAAGSTFNFTNYGETWIDNVKRVSYNQDAKQFIKVDYNGKPLKQGERIEFQLHQLVEKKDGTNYTKTWYIDMRESGKRAKDKTVWGEITKPSVLTVFSDLKSFFAAMQNHAICAIEDYVTGKTRIGTDSNGMEREYDVTAPKFIATFKNEAEAKKDKDKRFKKAEAESNNGSIPSEIIGQVRGLLKSTKNNIEQVKELLTEDDDFSVYDVDELIAEAQKPPF